MANLKSTKKDIRRSEKRRIANSEKKSALRTQSKNILKSLKNGKPEEALAFFKTFTSLLDKAAKINLVHKKNADRKKSRMAKRIAAATKSQKA